MASSDVVAASRTAVEPLHNADSEGLSFRGSSPRPRRALGPHLGLLTAAAVYLVLMGRNQWFYFDEWMFLGHQRDLNPSVLSEYLAPHYGHWSTVPLAIYQVLRSAVGLHSYWPYLGLLFLLHLTATHLLWRLSLRLGAKTWSATAVCAVFGVLGAGWENILWAFQIGLVGSVVLGLFGVLVCISGELTRGRVVGLSLLLVANLATSGVGLVFLVVITALAVMRVGRAGLKVALVPTLVYVAWFWVYQTAPPVPWTGPPLLLPIAFLAFLGTGLTTTVTSFLGLLDVETKLPVLLGTVPLLAFSIATWRLGKLGGRRGREASVIAAGAVFFYALTATARIGMGPDQARAARYVYIAIALCIPALAVLLGRAARSPRVRGAAVGVLVVVGVANALNLASMASILASNSSAERSTLFAAVKLTESGERTYPDTLLSPTKTTGITMADVREWRRKGQFPPLGRTGAVDQATAAVSLQVHARRVSTDSLAGLRCKVVPYGRPISVAITSGMTLGLRVQVNRQVAMSLTTSTGVTSRWLVETVDPGTYRVETVLPAGVLHLMAGDTRTSIEVC